MYVDLHPNFLLTFRLPAWVDDDDVRFFSFLLTWLGRIHIVHVDGRPTQSQTNSVLKLSRLA